MNYKILINPKAEKFLSKIDAVTSKKMRGKMRLLSEEPRPSGVKKLSGINNSYRIRVGDYRIIYVIHDHQVLILVINIGHRKEVYK